MVFHAETPSMLNAILLLKMKTTTQNLNQRFPQISLPVIFICCMLLHVNVFGQTSAEEISKKLNNPVSSLISVPLQNNMEAGIGPLKGYQNRMNVQPVIPFNFTKDWNLITRTVLPVVTQTNITSIPDRQTGLSDMVASAFLSPAKSDNGLVWGAGPAFLVPTATNGILGTKQWGVGPTACVLFQESGWTYGVLVNQIWSYAGSAKRDEFNQFYALPFLNYHWPSGATLGVTADVTRDWEHHYTNAVITPTISGLTRIGKQNFQLQVGPMIPVSAVPGEKPDFGVRAAITFVFPRKARQD
jgi:hypothetical protein